LIGDVVILAPANYKIKILAKALIGDLKYDKIRDDGLFCRIEHEDESYGSAEKGWFINANGLIGDLTIQRIAG